MGTTTTCPQCLCMCVRLVMCRAIKMLTQRDAVELEGDLHRVFKMFCENQSKLMTLKGKEWQV